MSPWVVTEVLPPHHSQYLLVWLHHQYWRSWASKAILLKSLLHWADLISRIGNHCLLWIILCSTFSASYCDREAWIKWYKDCLKKSLGICHVYHRQWSALAENHDAWHLIIDNIVFFKNTCRAALNNIRCRMRMHNIMLSNTDQTFSCSHCNHAGLFHIGLSCAIDMDCALVFSFIKPNLDSVEFQWVQLV